MGSELDNLALRIHGVYISEPSSVESSDVDEEYFDNEPPPEFIDTNSVVVCEPFQVKQGKRRKMKCSSKVVTTSNTNGAKSVGRKQTRRREISMRATNSNTVTGTTRANVINDTKQQANNKLQRHAQSHNLKCKKKKGQNKYKKTNDTTSRPSYVFKSSDYPPLPQNIPIQNDEPPNNAGYQLPVKTRQNTMQNSDKCKQFEPLIENCVNVAVDSNQNIPTVSASHTTKNPRLNKNSVQDYSCRPESTNWVNSENNLVFQSSATDKSKKAQEPRRRNKIPELMVQKFQSSTSVSKPNNITLASAQNIHIHPLMQIDRNQTVHSNQNARTANTSNINSSRKVKNNSRCAKRTNLESNFDVQTNVLGKTAQRQKKPVKLLRNKMSVLKDRSELDNLASIPTQNIHIHPLMQCCARNTCSKSYNLHDSTTQTKITKLLHNNLDFNANQKKNKKCKGIQASINVKSAYTQTDPLPFPFPSFYGSNANVPTNFDYLLQQLCMPHNYV